ncbi:MAG: pilus assembly protein N-terminal domain-containing protein [Candidatus Omnitrophica bacterium]|nr:pilus assembly protein N-terminal domain-containing protein [Candidatus Omnitrophota bacterium]
MDAKVDICHKKGFSQNPFFICLCMLLAFLMAVSCISFVPLAQAAYVSSEMAQFLCEIGISFYKQARYDEALHEFRKALMVQPNYDPALRYIQMIEQMREEFPSRPSVPVSSQVVEKYLDLFQIQREMIKERGAVIPGVIKPLPGRPGLPGRPIIAIKEKIFLPKTINLDTSLSQMQQPIEIEQGKSIILLGKNIQRFLLTQPDILIAEQKSKDELLITGRKIGYTYLHVWDDSGRKTVEFLCILPKPTGPTLEEEMRLAEEIANSFKIRYSLDWHSFEQGRRLDSLDRQNYFWYHNLNLTGVTPYGNLDSTAIERTLAAKSLERSTDLTYFTLGLTEGKLGSFKDFSLRGFDLYPGFSNLASGGMSALRGGMLESPAFDKAIDYTVFWGREGTGKFGGLSPGLQKLRRAYIEGVDLNYRPGKNLDYGVSVLHGYGRDRPSYFNDYTYDARAGLHLGNWGYQYEIAYIRTGCFPPSKTITAGIKTTTLTRVTPLTPQLP